MLYSVMAIDVGISTGYAVMRQDGFIECVGVLEIDDSDQLMQTLYSIAYKHKVDQIVIEYPVLNRKHNYYNQLRAAYSNVDEFVMNIKEAQTWGMVVTEITPSQWKIKPVLELDLLQFPRNGAYDASRLSQHEKDAIMICYYTFKWSL